MVPGFLRAGYRHHSERAAWHLLPQRPRLARKCVAASSLDTWPACTHWLQVTGKCRLYSTVAPRVPPSPLPLPLQVSNPRYKRHHFDGDGMVLSLAFREGRAYWRNRFVRTKGFVEEQVSGAVAHGCAGTLTRLHGTPRARRRREGQLRRQGPTRGTERDYGYRP